MLYGIALGGSRRLFGVGVGLLCLLLPTLRSLLVVQPRWLRRRSESDGVRKIKESTHVAAPCLRCLPDLQVELGGAGQLQLLVGCWKVSELEVVGPPKQPASVAEFPLSSVKE